jgi:hypothetical protein
MHWQGKSVQFDELAFVPAQTTFISRQRDRTRMKLMKSTRPRDGQRSLVYAWEKAASSGACGIPTFKTLAECQAFMNPIWNAERARYGRASVEAPAIERPARGQKRALAHASHKITLPKWARNEWVILHEMAHRLTPTGEAHGPRFVAVLIGLLARHAGYQSNQLMQSAAGAGVRYFAKSVGTVPAPPALNLSDRLVRLMPVAEIDAAFELDVSWRQVRGASLTLIRRGQARWLRGKLVALPAATNRMVACTA